MDCESFYFFLLFTETFKVDISNTKKLLEGERGEIIRQKDIVVSDYFSSLATQC